MNKGSQPKHPIGNNVALSEPQAHFGWIWLLNVLTTVLALAFFLAIDMSTREFLRESDWVPQFFKHEVVGVDGIIHGGVYASFDFQTSHAVVLSEGH